MTAWTLDPISASEHKMFFEIQSMKCVYYFLFETAHSNDYLFSVRSSNLIVYVYAPNGSPLQFYRRSNKTYKLLTKRLQEIGNTTNADHFFFSFAARTEWWETMKQ